MSRIVTVVAAGRRDGSTAGRQGGALAAGRPDGAASLRPGFGRRTRMVTVYGAEAEGPVRLGVRVGRVPVSVSLSGGRRSWGAGRARAMRGVGAFPLDSHLRASWDQRSDGDFLECADVLYGRSAREPEAGQLVGLLAGYPGCVVAACSGPSGRIALAVRLRGARTEVLAATAVFDDTPSGGTAFGGAPFRGALSGDAGLCAAVASIVHAWVVAGCEPARLRRLTMLGATVRFDAVCIDTVRFERPH